MIDGLTGYAELRRKLRHAADFLRGVHKNVRTGGLIHIPEILQVSLHVNQNLPSDEIVRAVKLTMENFPLKLRELRTAKRMSQAEVGDVLGVTRSAVQQWERGKNTPSLANLSELARFFDVTLADLMGAPAEPESLDAELRELPADIALLLKKSFLTTIRGMKPPKKL